MKAVSEWFKWENKDLGDVPLYKEARGAAPIFWVKLAVMFVIAIGAILLIDLHEDAILSWLRDLGLPKILAVIPTITLFPLVLFATAWFLFNEATRSLFRRFKKGNTKTILLLFVGYLVYAITANALLKALGQTTVADSAFGHQHGVSETEASLGLLLQLPFQLISEELFGILTFLSIMAVCYGACKMGRKTSLITALLSSAIIFGLMHYKAYDWHLAQMLVIIGGSRIFLTFAYLKTKNIWASFMVHFAIDGGTTLLGLLVSLGK